MTENNFKKYYNAVRYMESLKNIPQPDYMDGKENFAKWLERFAFFMDRLGNPQTKYKCVHIGGSSGKGSVAAMMQSVLTAAGYKTGLSTSPHQTTAAERIKVNGLFIAPDEFALLVEEIKPIIDAVYAKSKYGVISYFEICTALAFLYFARQKCDYAVMEVGCGGRFDATNIIPAPEITIINLIDYDHEELLGHTLTAIAAEKAAIIKPGTAFFTTAANKPAVLKIFAKECAASQAEYNVIQIDGEKYKLNLLGEHQQQNARLVAAACRHLHIAEKQIRVGLAQAGISCRFEKIQDHPLVILDGAHNSSKMQTTDAMLNNLTYLKLFLIIALTGARKPNLIFNDIIKKADQIFVTRHQNYFRPSYDPRALALMIKKISRNKKTVIFLDPFQALAAALKQADKRDAILVTGSLYLAGELRKHWITEEFILKNRKS